MFHELELRHLINFFRGILCIHVKGCEFITSLSCFNKKLNRGVEETSADKMVVLSVSKAFLL